MRLVEDWEIYITRQRTGHNHEVSPEAYKTYHEAREVSDTEVLAGVRTLHRAGANRKRILEYIMENTSAEPSMKDVHNLVVKLRQESYAFQTIEERIKAILEDFAAQEGNLTRVYTNYDVSKRYSYVLNALDEVLTELWTDDVDTECSRVYFHSVESNANDVCPLSRSGIDRRNSRH